MSVTFFCENTMPLFAHKSRQNIPMHQKHYHIVFYIHRVDGYYRRIDEGNKPIAMSKKQPENNDLFKELAGQMELGALPLKRAWETLRFGA